MITKLTHQASLFSLPSTGKLNSGKINLISEYIKSFQDCSTNVAYNALEDVFKMKKDVEDMLKSTVK